MILLKLARIKADLTQKDLADKSGVSRSTICSIEKHGIENTPVKTLRKLATALDTDVQNLFFSEEN